MKPPCLGLRFAVIKTLAFSLALVSNATLALLIVYKTSSELRRYSRVLLCSCIVDTAFSAASFLFQVHGDMRHGMFLMITNGVVVGDLQRNLGLVSVYMFAVYSTILYGAVPMTFRYMVVYREYTMSRKEFTILILFVLFLASWPPAAYFYTWWPSSLVTTQKYADLIENSTCQDVGQIYISPLSEMLWAKALPFAVVGAVVSAAYVVIVFCAHKVSRKVKSVKTWSASARDAQNQIHTALLFQSATPLMLDVIPVGMFIFATIGGLEQLHFVILFATSCLAWIPVVNPLSAIFFIKCYRTEVCKLTGSLQCGFVSRRESDTQRPHLTPHNVVRPLPSTNLT